MNNEKNDYFNNTYDLKMDQKAAENLSALENLFEQSNNEDKMEKTSEISSVELEELRELSKKLHEKLEQENKPQESSSQEKGKQKVLTNNSKIKYSEDVSQIVTSFMSCFVLALVTATIGTGWLLYLINHL